MLVGGYDKVTRIKLNTCNLGKFTSAKHLHKTRQ